MPPGISLVAACHTYGFVACPRVLFGSLKPRRPQLSQRNLALAALAALLLLTVAVYARGLRGEFEFDDVGSVEFNQDIRHLGHFFSTSSIIESVRGKRVLTDFTFALNYWAAGLAPLPYHLTNLAIHLAATVLAFLFTRRVLEISGAGDKILLSVFVAGVFALHPLQTQAVIYVCQRAESLASALYLGSLLLIIRAERSGRSAAGAAFYATSFAFFALGLGAKIIVVTLPVAYLLIGLLPGTQEGAPGRHPRPARLLVRVALSTPFFAYGLTTTAFAVTHMKGEDAGFAVPNLPPLRYFLTEWHVLATYLRLLVWPAGQNLDWDFPLAQGLGDPAVFLSGFLLAVLVSSAGILYLRCRSRADSLGSAGRGAAFGLAWFFLLLVPTSSVIPLADPVMEHRLYLASWGVFLVIAVLATRLIRRLAWLARPRVLAAALACLCVGLASATYLRVGVWRSKLTLWSDCVVKSPHKARVHLGLGNAYRKVGEVPKAIQELNTALDLARSDPRWLRLEIRAKLATSLLSLGRGEEAVAAVQAGLAEKSDDVALLGLLAMAHLQRHDLPAAEAAAEDSVRAARKPAASLRIMGLVRLAQGEQDGATAAFEQAVAMDPDEPQGKLLLARAYRTRGQLEQACDLLRGRFNDLQAQVKEERAGCPEP